MAINEENCDVELERREAAKPIGDFIAQVASALTVIACFLTWYEPMGGKEYNGYQTPYGIIILIAAGLCFAFSSSVLIMKFMEKDFWMSRSPGWAYALAAVVIIIVSVIAMLFPYKNDPNYGAMVGTMFTGLFIMFGGLLKF